MASQQKSRSDSVTETHEVGSMRFFGLERIGALSDGVVAIAITLLVLELKVPDIVVTHSVLEHELMGQVPELIAWVISFFVIAMIWYDQHFLFAHMERCDSGFIATNMIQLGGVSLIPVAAHLIGRFSEDIISAVVFSFIMSVNGLLMTINAWYLSQHDALHSHMGARFLYRRAIYHTSSFIVIASIATAIAFAGQPLLGQLVWIALPLTFMTYHSAYNRYLEKHAVPKPLNEES